MDLSWEIVVFTGVVILVYVVYLEWKISRLAAKNSQNNFETKAAAYLLLLHCSEDHFTDSYLACFHDRLKAVGDTPLCLLGEKKLEEIRKERSKRWLKKILELMRKEPDHKGNWVLQIDIEERLEEIQLSLEDIGTCKEELEKLSQPTHPQTN